jgi:hypothetical protein
MSTPEQRPPLRALTRESDARDVDRLAALVALAIPAEYREGVRVAFERNAAIAALVMDFELPDTVEPAPIYTNDGL